MENKKCDYCGNKAKWYCKNPYGIEYVCDYHNSEVATDDIDLLELEKKL